MEPAGGVCVMSNVFICDLSDRRVEVCRPEKRHAGVRVLGRVGHQQVGENGHANDLRNKRYSSSTGSAAPKRAIRPLLSLLSSLLSLHHA